MNRSKNPYTTMALLFIPSNQEGILVTKMKEMEEKLLRLGSKKMPGLKLVEQTGIMLRSVLTNVNPWMDSPCDHTECTICNGEHRRDCLILSMVYDNTSCANQRRPGYAT